MSRVRTPAWVTRAKLRLKNKTKKQKTNSGGCIVEYPIVRHVKNHKNVTHKQVKSQSTETNLEDYRHGGIISSAL